MVERAVSITRIPVRFQLLISTNQIMARGAVPFVLTYGLYFLLDF
jgi:hypothetical protein